jgi:hypothetical protein
MNIHRLKTQKTGDMVNMPPAIITYSAPDGTVNLPNIAKP